MPTSFKPKLRRVLIGGFKGEDVVHFESAFGQSTPTLCGWEGGGPARSTDLEPTCKECHAIVNMFDNLRKVRVS